MNMPLQASCLIHSISTSSYKTAITQSSIQIGANKRRFRTSEPRDYLGGLSPPQVVKRGSHLIPRLFTLGKIQNQRPSITHTATGIIDKEVPCHQNLAMTLESNFSYKPQENSHSSVHGHSHTALPTQSIDIYRKPNSYSQAEKKLWPCNTRIILPGYPCGRLQNQPESTQPPYTTAAETTGAKNAHSIGGYPQDKALPFKTSRLQTPFQSATNAVQIMDVQRLYFQFSMSSSSPFASLVRGGKREAGWEVGHSIWQRAYPEREARHGMRIPRWFLGSLEFASVITAASAVPAAILAVARRLGAVSSAFVGLHPATNRLG